jgi:glycosyltransferase involved in cell wall biosynthesis
MVSLGIGITTYNHKPALENTLERVRRHTRHPHLLAVGDDGSTDGTAELLEVQHIVRIGGPNRGIAWNKNRLLFALNNVAKCDILILLDDDAYPIEDGWEEPWMRAAMFFGHISLADDGLREQCQSGSGTPEDPLLSLVTSGRCVAYASEAIEAVGFMDTRYRRGGYEHTEHSFRMVKAGFGGVANAAKPDQPWFYLLTSPRLVTSTERDGDEALLAHNSTLFTEIRDESIHRWAWRGDEERTKFLAGIRPASKALRASDTRPTVVTAIKKVSDPAVIAGRLDTPHLFGEELLLMRRAFEMAGPNYLEFGTGGSTLLAVRRGGTVVSVESDPQWAAGVRARDEIAEAISEGRATILHADIGPVGDFGHPHGRDHLDRWISYLYLPWREWVRRGATPDLVYVDGRFRVACCMSVIVALAQKLKSREMPLVLMHDISEVRPFYNPVFSYYETLEAVGSLHLMRVRADVSGAAAFVEMLRHQNDPR